MPDNQLSLAIGKEGQNARLAAKLTGWKIDIKSQSQYAEQMAAAVPQVEDEEQPAQELPEDETAGQKATGADTEAADKKASDKEKTAESEGTEDEQ